ncbi:MAG TPA: cupredoxin family copper-binding protein [Acidobacteriaceae bacterium]|nr:cupredoxin family copper-binding protein [Acidobacteriaceae bacterium]
MWVLRSALWVMAALVSFQTLPSDARKAEIRIDQFSFSPAVLTVKTGTPITWTNNDDIPHTVVDNGHTFKSKVLGTGEKFTFTADKPGSYSYSCSIHPNMTGKVIVK